LSTRIPSVVIAARLLLQNVGAVTSLLAVIIPENIDGPLAIDLDLLLRPYIGLSSSNRLWQTHIALRSSWLELIWLLVNNALNA
jgi:hypothetical protein